MMTNVPVLLMQACSRQITIRLPPCASADHAASKAASQLGSSGEPRGLAGSTCGIAGVSQVWAVLWFAAVMMLVHV